MKLPKKFQADCVDHRLRGSNALVDFREIGIKRGLEIARPVYYLLFQVVYLFGRVRLETAIRVLE